MHSIQLTLAQSVWLEKFKSLTLLPDPSCKLVFLGQSIVYLYGRCHMYFTKSFVVLMFEMYLA